MSDFTKQTQSNRINPRKAKNVGRWAVYANRVFDYFRAQRSYTPNALQPKQADQSAAVKQTQKMAKVLDTAEEVLLQVNSQFPFQLFPDSLRVDRQKVILTHRTFIGVAQIINIQIEDLQAIEADVGPLFGSISITTKQFSNTVNKIHTLARSDVMRAQHLLQGFIIANKKKLDYSKIEKNQLIGMLEELGRGSHGE